MDEHFADIGKICLKLEVKALKIKLFFLMFSKDQILAASDFANVAIIDYIFWC